MPTLLRVLVEATGLSRRKAFACIREGRLTVDGQVVRDPSAPYEGGALALDGEPISRPAQPHVYLMLNKPPGFVSTRSDELGRATIYDLVPPELRAPGLHSVGRLDKDTSGLLLLTTDGNLTFALTHPRHEVEKEYWVGFGGPVREELVAAVRGGVVVDGAMRVPVRVDRLVGQRPYTVTVTLREGRKRQVRRMFDALGLKVVALKRVREGPLALGDLPEGAVRPLTLEELRELGVRDKGSGVGSSRMLKNGGTGGRAP